MASARRMKTYNPIQMFMVPATRRRIVKWRATVHISVNRYVTSDKSQLCAAIPVLLWRNIYNFIQMWQKNVCFQDQ